MKLIAFLSALLLTGTDLYAQQNWPPVYEIMTDTVTRKEISYQYLQVLEDKNGEWTLQQVSSPSFSKGFRQFTNETLYNLAKTYWIRFWLHNAMNKEAKVGFFAGNGKEDYYLEYANGTREHMLGGRHVPWSKKDGFKRINYIPFTIKPGETITVYKRVYNSWPFPPENLSIYFGFTDKVIQQRDVESETNYFSAIHNSFNFGFLFVAALFAIFFFFIVWEKVYLYFALYVFTLGLGRFYSELYHLFFREYPIVIDYLYFYGLWLIITFFQTHFIRHLLKTYQYLPRLDSFLYFFSFLPFLFEIISVFLRPHLTQSGRDILFVISFSNQPIVVLTALLTFFLVLVKQKWSNKLLAYAIFPSFCVWGVLWSTHRFSVIAIRAFHVPPTAFTQWLFDSWYLIETICLGWQVIFFSWILLHRFSEQRKQISQLALEKEKEQSELIRQKNEELERKVEERTAQLRNSLEQLKSTQQQLIQQEKMASLGELTAGIAHEIQNPLNFINNFSELSVELLQEAKTVIKAQRKEDAIEAIDDAQENLQKVIHHGRRADAIVKNMLQHARKSTGEKEPVNINDLVDECLRLSYHGIRAKDKSLHSIIETHFDASIGKMNVIPQDFSRVLLNLFNNAFYAVAEKKKNNSDDDFEPIVQVTTQQKNGSVEIKVRDNGTGIPEKVLEKIYQPFFTTKPTGEGTGLGLSLSYDIITKAHGGELKVETKEGEGAEFIICLPVE